MFCIYFMSIIFMIKYLFLFIMSIFITYCKEKEERTQDSNEQKASELVRLSKNIIYTDEKGREDSFEVSLLEKPDVAVKTYVSSTEPVSVRLYSIYLEFTPENWQTPQMVKVTGVNDSMMDGDKEFFIELSPLYSDDLYFNGYDPPDVKVVVYETIPGQMKFLYKENEIEKDVLFSGITMKEGTTKELMADFGSIPLGVIIMKLSSESNFVTIEPSEIPIDVQSYQTLTPFKIISKNDGLLDENFSTNIHIELILRDEKLPLDHAYLDFYEGLGENPSIKINVIDSGTETPGSNQNDEGNDKVDVLYNTIEGAEIPQTIRMIEQDGTESTYLYTISLGSQPSSEVSITISLSDDTLDNLGISSNDLSSSSSIDLNFTEGDWNIPQRVILTLYHNEIASGDISTSIIHNVVSENNVFSETRNLILVDDDIAKINVPFNLILSEGGAANINISITSQPISDIAIQLVYSLENEITLSSSEFTFTSDHWSTPKNITIFSKDNKEYNPMDRISWIHYSVTTDPENIYSVFDSLRTQITIVEDIPDSPCERPDFNSIDHFPSNGSHGKGSFSDPYTICNAMQLQYIKNDMEKYYVLEHDIDMSAYDSKREYICPAGTLGVCSGFQPIGNCGIDGICGDNLSTPENESVDDIGFKGTLDGNEYIISNLMVNINISKGSATGGLIGRAKNGALIKNVRLENVNILSTSSENDVFSYAGGLVGFNDGVIRKSSSTGNVSSLGAKNFTGGIVGRNDPNGKITDVYSVSDLSAHSTVSYGYVGGLAGQNRGMIFNGYSSSYLIAGGAYLFSGGLIGQNRGLVINGYSNGNVSSMGLSATSGSLVGHNLLGTIRNSYSTTSSSVNSLSSKVGGLLGNNERANVINSYFDKDLVELTKDGSIISGISIELDNGDSICIDSFSSMEFKINASVEEGNCDSSNPVLFFQWRTPFDIDGDSVADEESVRYATVENGALDEFIWDFGNATEYPILASVSQTADEQAVRMASGFLRFSNTMLGEPSSSDPVFFHDIGSGSSITISGKSVQGTTASNYAIEDANGNTLTAPTVTDAGVINGVNSLTAGAEFYLKVTFTRGASPNMASFTRRYRFKK